MAADFTLVAGTQKHLVPSASLAGAPVDFPAGSVFSWTVDPPNVVTIDNNGLASPAITGVVATDPASPATIKLVVAVGGTLFEKTHTLDVTAAVVIPLDAVDFTLQ